MVLIVLVFALCLGSLLFFSITFRHGLWKSRITRKRKGPRLSKDPKLIRPEYDVVVIGSGYGGGVAASRMARAGKRVCVLERGAEKWPGEYPHTLRSALGEYCVRDSRPGRSSSLGKESGLFQMRKGDGQDIFSGCGLGGTSLINAGVFLRPERRIFEGAEWPAEIRKNIQGLDIYFQKAEQMFRPTPFPNHMPKPSKTSIFEEQARSLGLHRYLFRPPLTTYFEDGINRAGVEMRQSARSGNECTGVNDGSKNSVLVTYLADAWTWGTEMFCGIDVRYVQRAEKEDGYVVYYESVDSPFGRKRRMWVQAKELVVLGAGALGTTEILLRSRSHGLQTSNLLGERISGNGDLLAFAYNSDRHINGVGLEPHANLGHARCGPTITSCIDMRRTKEATNFRDGFVIQEGAIPEALGPVIQMILETRISMSVPSIKRCFEKIVARLKSWMYGPYCALGSVDRTAVYLVMSHDEKEGIMKMKDDRLLLQWSEDGAKPRGSKIQDMLSKAAASIRATLVQVPYINVHPLGGACMSYDNSGSGGVVNHMGQLFSGSSTEIHSGILCVDASIIPTSVGINPSATITALAERCCELMIRERKWNIDTRQNEPLDLYGQPYKSIPLRPQSKRRQEQFRLNRLSDGLQFDEDLHGFLRPRGEHCDFETCAETAAATLSHAKLSVAVSIYRHIRDTYEGVATGTLSYTALSPDPLLIIEGTVSFFTPDLSVSDAVNLVYDLELLSTDGTHYNFYGYKVIDSSVAFSAFTTWKCTTTLYTTISLPDGTQVAKGILRLSPGGFAAEIASFRCSPEIRLMRRITAMIRFFNFFIINLTPYTLGPFRTLQYSDGLNVDFRHFQKPQPVEVWIRSADGVKFCIKKWEASTGAPRRMPLVLIPGASVDDQLFSTPTIPTNAIDYFTSRGYRCYVPILRFGASNDEARDGWTVFDSRLDVTAALQYIRDQEEDRKVYVIVHCLGSIAMATALLNGDIEADWFSGMTCSQVFTDLLYSKDNVFKARHQILIQLYKAIAGDWFSCRSSPSATWIQFFLDQVLRLYPTGNRKEMCNSATCHRCDLPFGRCWSHANLNRATHDAIGEIFDGIHMNLLTHLSSMGVAQGSHVRSNMPEFIDLMTPHNLQRLASLRLCFLSGGDNAVWKPAATKRSFDTFRQFFPDGDYQRIVVQGFGHMDCWIGKDAYKDVYPRVAHHVQACELYERNRISTAPLASRREYG